MWQRHSNGGTTIIQDKNRTHSNDSFALSIEPFFTVTKFVCVLTIRHRSNAPIDGDGITRFVAHM